MNLISDTCHQVMMMTMMKAMTLTAHRRRTATTRDRTTDGRATSCTRVKTTRPSHRVLLAPRCLIRTSEKRSYYTRFSAI